MKWIVHSSAVRVSDSRGDRLYPSLEEAPEELRRKIGECVAAKTAQTVLIANQEAYDRILAGQDELPPELKRLRPALMRHRTAGVRAARKPTGDASDWRGLLAAGLGAIVLLWAVWLWALRASL